MSSVLIRDEAISASFLGAVWAGAGVFAQTTSGTLLSSVLVHVDNTTFVDNVVTADNSTAPYTANVNGGSAMYAWAISTQYGATLNATVSNSRFVNNTVRGGVWQRLAGENSHAPTPCCRCFVGETVRRRVQT